MSRLLKTVLVLVIVLGVVFGGRMLLDRLEGTSLADGLPPTDQWRTVRVGSFSVRLPHEPTRQSNSTGPVSMTLLTLARENDSLIIRIDSSPQPMTADADIQHAAAGSHGTLRETAPTTVGGQPATRYRFTAQAGDQPVTGFGAALVHGQQTILLQYAVGGSPTAVPKLFQEVLGTVTFAK